MRKNIIALCFLLLLSFTIKAQMIKRAHAKRREAPPKAILVQLPTETNRMNYFLKSGKKKNAAELRIDMDSITAKMAADFKDHFSYCPVYYFYDTSVLKITERKFDGILLDARLQPVTNIAISTEDTNYFIVYYGYEGPDARQTKANSGDPYSSGYNNNSLPMLIAMDYRFKQLRSPLPYKVRGQGSKILAMSNDLMPYTYESKHFNLSYSPLAYFYNRTLNKFYGHEKMTRKYK